MRYPIPVKNMMVIVAILAVGMGALANPTRFRADLLLLLTQILLLTGTLGAMFHRARRQVIWTGFSTFGWFYFLLYFAPLFSDQTGMVVPTQGLYAWAFDSLHPLDEMVKLARTRPGITSAYNDMAENFYQAAHLEATLLFSLLGAWIAARVVACEASDNHPIGTHPPANSPESGRR